jgi:hypothetical protein
MSVHWGGRGAGHVSRLSTATTGVPSLALDFLSGTLDSRITFTRSSTATFVGSNGLIQTAAINDPRFDYNPVTLALNGLLIEEQRVNLLLYSEQLDNAYWQKSKQGTGIAPVVTANAATAPDGTMTADQVVFASVGTGSGDRSRLLTALLGLATGTYTVSFWVKAASPSQPNLSLFIQSGVNSLVVVPTTEWVRYTYTATETNQRPELRLSGNVGTLGTYYVWGAQLEAGAFPTSYIPTVASQVTRTADIATMTGTNFSDWYNQTEGSFVFQYSRYQNTDAFGIVLETKPSSTSTADRFGAAATSTADPRFQLFPNGSTVLDTGGTFGVLPVNTVVKGAFAYRSGDSAATRNGASPSNSATAFATPTYTNLQIGGTDNTLYGPATTSQLNGHIRQIAYYNTRLSNSSLQAITA